MSLGAPPLLGPALASHTYHPYQTSSRLKTHDAILRPLSPYAYGFSSERDEGECNDDDDDQPESGPSRSSAARRTKRWRERQQLAVERAEARALAGKRPAGVDMHKEAEELSDEERLMEDERDNLNLFGHRFLLPYGRRQTQSELDAAPASPTPSQEGQDRMQEDPMGGGMAGTSPLPAASGTDELELGEGDGEGEVVDLDASLEDMDADDGDDTGIQSDEE